MSFLNAIFGEPAVNRLPEPQKREANRLLDELVKIGQMDDFLSLSPGGQFNIRCHHVRACQIGKQLNDLGGFELMMAARSIIKRKLKATLAEHLDYCWHGIGDWKA